MEELHWFCFSYVGDHAEASISTGTVHGSTYTGYAEKKITIKNIKENKAYAKMSEDSAVVSISYLGHMTREEFTEGTDE